MNPTDTSETVSNPVSTPTPVTQGAAKSRFDLNKIKAFLTSEKHRKLVIGSGVAVLLLIGYTMWNNNYQKAQAEELAAIQAQQQAATQAAQQQAAVAGQQQQGMPTAVIAVDQRTGVKVCQNVGLGLVVTLPPDWFCLKGYDQDDLGHMFMTNGALIVEVENLGRAIGCNPEQPGCLNIPFYSSAMMELFTAQINGENAGVFGIFNDSTDDRSYGGIVIRRTSEDFGTLTPQETQELSSILDTFQRAVVQQ